jgi:hypothetical protein
MRARLGLARNVPPERLSPGDESYRHQGIDCRASFSPPASAPDASYRSLEEGLYRQRSLDGIGEREPTRYLFLLPKDIEIGLFVEIVMVLPTVHARVRFLGRIQRTQPQAEHQVGVAVAIKHHQFLRDERKPPESVLARSFPSSPEAKVPRSSLCGREQK